MGSIHPLRVEDFQKGEITPPTKCAKCGSKNLTSEVLRPAGAGFGTVKFCFVVAICVDCKYTEWFCQHIGARIGWKPLRIEDYGK